MARTTLTTEELAAKAAARKEARKERVTSFWDILDSAARSLNAAVRTKIVRTDETAFRSISIICSEMQDVLLNSTLYGKPQIEIVHDYIRNRAYITFTAECLDEGDVFKVTVKETGYDQFGRRLDADLIETEVSFEYNGAFWTLISKIEDALRITRMGW